MSKTNLISLVLATLFTLSQAANVSYVYQISTPGYTRPAIDFGLTNDESDAIPSSKLDRLTALGIRQQFLIGDELAARYLNDSTVVRANHHAEDIFIQSQWWDTSILSAQAQLHGIYKNGQNDLTLNDKQQQNAVPPLEGVDFSDEIANMGAAALPYQTTNFPIQMNPKNLDFLFSLDSDNCDYVQTENTLQMGNLQESWLLVLQLEDKILHDMVKSDLDNNPTATVQQYCDYIEYAMIYNLDLADSRDVDTLMQACQNYHQMSSLYLSSAEINLNGISTNEMRRSVMEHVQAWTYTESDSSVKDFFTEEDKEEVNENIFTSTKLYTMLQAKAKKEAVLEGLREVKAIQSVGYNWFSGWTTKQMLHLFTVSISQDQSVNQLLPLQEGSLMIFEVFEEGQQWWVKALLNDKPIILNGCTSSDACLADDFVRELDSHLQFPGHSDVATQCSTSQ